VGRVFRPVFPSDPTYAAAIGLPGALQLMPWRIPFGGAAVNFLNISSTRIASKKQSTITPTYCNDHLWGTLSIYYCNAGVFSHHATAPFLIAFFVFKNPVTVSRLCRDLPFFGA
jgi:hypothetical protein